MTLISDHVPVQSLTSHLHDPILWKKSVRIRRYVFGCGCSIATITRVLQVFIFLLIACRFRRGKNLFQNIRQRREYGKVERRFALSGASSVCDFTDY